MTITLIESRTAYRIFAASRNHGEAIIWRWTADKSCCKGFLNCLWRCEHEQPILCWCSHMLLRGNSTLQSTSHYPTNNPRATHWIEHVQPDEEILGFSMHSMDWLSHWNINRLSLKHAWLVNIDTHLCNDTPHLVVVHRVWCGAHQLDLVAQSATRKVLDG